MATATVKSMRSAVPMLRMVTVPAILLSIKGLNVDLKDPLVVMLSRCCFIGMLSVMGAVYITLYMRIRKEGNASKFCDVPKPKSPFAALQGPEETTTTTTPTTTNGSSSGSQKKNTEAASPGGGSDVDRMSYKDYDIMEFNKALRTLATLAVISLVAHFQFKMVPPLFIQAVMQPLSLIESPLFRLYALNETEDDDAALVRPFKPPLNPLASMMGLNPDGSSGSKSQAKKPTAASNGTIDSSTSNSSGADTGAEAAVERVISATTAGPSAVQRRSAKSKRQA